MKNKILTVLNAALRVTNLFGSFRTHTLDGLPLGTAGNSATGEILLKVSVREGTVTIVPGTGASAQQMQGTAADGATAVGNPVQVGGKDGSGNIQSILTGTDGSVTINIPAGITSIGGTKDNGPQWTPTRTYTAISTATTTDVTAAPTSGQKIYLDDCLISCDAACAVSLIEETSGTVFAKAFIPANGTVQITLRDGIKAVVADKKIRAITSAAVNTSITACYHSEV